MFEVAAPPTLAEVAAMPMPLLALWKAARAERARREAFEWDRRFLGLCTAVIAGTAFDPTGWFPAIYRPGGEDEDGIEKNDDGYVSRGGITDPAEMKAFLAPLFASTAGTNSEAAKGATSDGQSGEGANPQAVREGRPRVPNR